MKAEFESGRMPDDPVLVIRAENQAEMHALQVWLNAHGMPGRHLVVVMSEAPNPYKPPVCRGSWRLAWHGLRNV